MEAKCTRLEKELEERSVDKLDGEEEDNATSHQVGLAWCQQSALIITMTHPQQPSYESSSDLGIESGTEVEDSLSEKWARQQASAWIMDFYKKQRNSLYCTYNVKIASAPSILYFITQILSL